jgi:NAD(P)-dependent dehydrogenase (short-subunit alcohol dehydrogenase family)
MKISLEGKTALVTGASRGLGRAIAAALVEAGADVILMGRSKPDLEQTALEIGAKASALVCDVTDNAALETAFANLEHLDILVNNAGMNIPEPFLEVTAGHFDQVFDLNVRAAFFVTQHALKRMTQGAVILNVSSQMGHVGAVNRSVYCASKHALEGLTKALGVELAPRGIRVVSIAPTFIETEMTRPMFQNENFKNSVLESIPLGHLGQVEDVSGAVVFLVSSHARFVTGSSLKIDGGWTAK